MDVFNNREIALIIWIGIIALCFGLFPKLREIAKSFKPVLVAFFQYKIQINIALMFIYVLGIIYLLVRLGLWDFSQIKNTVIWMFSVGLFSFFQIEKIKKDRKFFKHVVLDNLKLLAIIEFIVGVYTFSLAIELVMLPILTMIVLLVAVADNYKEHVRVKIVLNNLLSFVGLFIIGYTIYMLSVDFEAFANRQTFYDFLIPVLLTILYIPFIFSLMVYMTYETVRFRLRYVIKKRKKRLFANIITMFVFNVRIDLLERWADTLHNEKTKTYEDIWESVKKIFKRRKIELNAAKVDERDGWSPFMAKDALVSNGITTGFYRKQEKKIWYACSNYIEIGGGFLPPNIAYYIEGDKRVAQQLKLVLNVHKPETQSLAHARLKEDGKTLFEYATKKSFPVWLGEALLKGHQIERTIDFFKVKIEKQKFKGEVYDIKFIISIESKL